MILVDWQIEKLCEEGIISPYEKELINPSSIDIRLGEIILLDIDKGYEKVNIKNTSNDNPYYIEPNHFILACTYESFNVPDNIAVELKLKSSRARERLSHSLAGHVDNGFHGVLTLELKNYSSKNPIPIWYKQRIGQAIFHKTAISDKPYQGKYSGFTTPVESLDKI